MIFTQNTQNAPKTRFSIGNHDFHPKHRECTENTLFQSEITIFTQNIQNAPKTESAEKMMSPDIRSRTRPVEASQLT